MASRLTLVVVLGFALGFGASCLDGWQTSGVWACSANDGGTPTCPRGFVCDDGLCCQRDSELGCPTLPTTRNGCRTGEAVLYYEDRDGDGEGNDRVSRYLCKAPLTRGWVTSLGDCDDNDAQVNTRTPEVCNGKNDNCDVGGLIDEGLTPRVFFFRDQDGDGYGDDTDRVEACQAPEGFVAMGGDCNPFSPAVRPMAGELCNGVDDDCDGRSDAQETSFDDTDDGTTTRFPCSSQAMGVCQPGTFRCRPVGNSVRRECVSARQPALVDQCDSLDNDCDGTVDEQPNCGGVPALLSGVVIGTQHGTTGPTSTQQQSGCIKDLMPDVQEWDGVTRRWTTTTAGYHLWYAEAPAGQTWDLTRRDLKLRLRMTGGATPPAAFGPPTRFRNPVIYLCGETAGELIRYVADFDDSLGLHDGGTPDTVVDVDSTFTLSSGRPVQGTTGFVVGRGSGFDTRRVKRIEVLVNGVSGYTLTFDPGSGFVP